MFSTGTQFGLMVICSLHLSDTTSRSREGNKNTCTCLESALPSDTSCHFSLLNPSQLVFGTVQVGPS